MMTESKLVDYAVEKKAVFAKSKLEQYGRNGI